MSSATGQLSSPARRRGPWHASPRGESASTALSSGDGTGASSQQNWSFGKAGVYLHQIGLPSVLSQPIVTMGPWGVCSGRL